MADFFTLSGVLAADVATSGTFTTGYPSGSSLGSFSMGTAHLLTVGGKLYISPQDFTVVFTSSTVITITWKGANTLKAGSSFRVQYDVAGPGDGASRTGDVTNVNRAVYTRDVMINFGAPIASAAASIRAAASVAGAGAVGSLITAGLTLDVPRNLIITSAANDSGITFTATGTDEYGVVMTETITGANTGVAAGKKAFKTITAITASGASAGNVSIGFGNVLGFPLWVGHSGCLAAEFQDLAKPTAGTTVGGLSPLTAATATTADVRGTYVPNAAPDGAKVYQVVAVVADASFKGVTQA